MSFFPMTPQGHKALQDELKHLKSEVRPKVINDIAVARAHGDLSENAEYDAAKERQAFVEARIKDIEAKLARCRIIDTSKLDGDKVVFGATVVLLDEETETEKMWTIVGEDEADIKSQKLSIASPLAKALIGKTIGDQVELNSPKGKIDYVVISVRFDA